MSEQDAASEWHLSQQKWHSRRRERGYFGWHRRQARWHGDRIPFSWLVARTFRQHAAQIAANVMASNALLLRLMK